MICRYLLHLSSKIWNYRISDLSPHGLGWLLPYNPNIYLNSSYITFIYSKVHNNLALSIAIYIFNTHHSSSAHNLPSSTPKTINNLLSLTSLHPQVHPILSSTELYWMFISHTKFLLQISTHSSHKRYKQKMYIKCIKT